jgi:hypothetical protein
MDTDSDDPDDSEDPKEDPKPSKKDKKDVVQSEPKETVKTRSGHQVRVPERFQIYEMNAANFSLDISSEARYIKQMRECFELSLFHVEKLEIHELLDKAGSPFETQFVGMRIGGGFTNTQELHVLNYNQAMKSPDKDK